MKNLFLTLAFCLVSLFAFAQEEVFLWEKGAPDAIGQDSTDKPSILVFPAPKQSATGTSVIICPGGGYGMKAMGHEGYAVAKWLNSIGVTAFVLKYRVGKWDGSGYKHPTMLGDASRAMRLVRAKAKDYDINPQRIGILGFSAGGHLASTLGTHFDAGNGKSNDKIEWQSSRPDFMVLIYPVISLSTKYVHRGSRQALLGQNPSASLVDSLSNEKQVTTLTPPTFLVHSTDDSAVPPENSVLFYLALRENGVPCELHIYEKGGHGYGMTIKDSVNSTWTDRCRDWLKMRGWLSK